MLVGLTAIHDSAKAHGYRAKATDRADIAFPASEHPVVRTHPETGRQALYVSRGFTVRIYRPGARFASIPGAGCDPCRSRCIRY